MAKDDDAYALEDLLLRGFSFNLTGKIFYRWIQQELNFAYSKKKKTYWYLIVIVKNNHHEVNTINSNHIIFVPKKWNI